MSNETDNIPTNWPRKYDIFGVGISATTYAEATETILRAAEERVGAVVSAHAVHALVTFSSSQELRDKANTFEMITPDGQPVRWALNRLHATRLTDRVYGPNLTLYLCAAAAERGVPIYLYGGANEDILEKLKTSLLARFPKLKIAGAFSPPFRALTEEESDILVDEVNSSGAGIFFIGLGCPKQDEFAYAFRDRMNAVLICVGAAFDFHAGIKGSAPAWMQKRGLEWLYRLVQEPRRLWKRYLVTNSIFVGKFAAALARKWFMPWKKPQQFPLQPIAVNAESNSGQSESVEQQNQHRETSPAAECITS